MNEPSDVTETLRFLQSHNVMSVATSGPDGIWNAAVFYVSHGFELFFVSPPDTRHCRNIAHTCEAAVTIQEDYAHWTEIKGIQMEATIGRLDGDEQAAAIALYREKFRFLDDPTTMSEKIIHALHKSAWYRVTPRRLFFVNNSRGFGNRLEIEITSSRDKAS